MSNVISTAYAASGQPLQAPLHLDFLQASPKADLANTIIAMIGSSYSPTTVYRLYGAELTNVTGDYYTNTAGAVFLNGEVYPVSVVGGGGVNYPDGIDMQVVVTPTGSTTFGDGSTHDVNIVRTMRYVNNATPVYGLPVGIRINSELNATITSNSTTVTFTQNSYVRMVAASASAVTITLDPTLGIAGNKATIAILPTNAANVIIFTSTGHRYISGDSVPNSGLENINVTIEYAGKDSFGDNVYFIDIKQIP